MKRKQKNSKKVVGTTLIVTALWILLPPYFLPVDIEFYFLSILPLIGLWALVMPFGLAAVMLVAGMYLLGLPLNGKGVKKAMKKVFKK